MERMQDLCEVPLVLAGFPGRRECFLLGNMWKYLKGSVVFPFHAGPEAPRQVALPVPGFSCEGLLV